MKPSLRRVDAPDSPLTLAPAAATDEEIVADVLLGVERAFEDLVRRHQQGIFAFLFRMTRDPDEAADVAQEVFLKVFANLEQFNPAYRFKTWLYRIAANAAVDRRRRRRATRSLSDMGLDDEDGASRIVSEEPGPYERLRERETRSRIEVALDHMPAAYRRVLLLRFQADLRYDEIAEITRLPLGTVKNRIFRAREMLKKALA